MFKMKVFSWLILVALVYDSTEAPVENSNTIPKDFNDTRNDFNSSFNGSNLSTGLNLKSNIDDTDVSTTVLAYYCEVAESCAPIYEHSKNPTWSQDRKRYYVFPQFRVDVNSITFESVAIFNKHFVSFEVQMFDQCYLKKVAAFLETIVNGSVFSYQVAPYGLHELRLSWASEPKPGLGIEISPDPITQTTQTPRVQLKFITKTGEKAKELATSLQTHPHYFDFVRLDYSLTGAQTSDHLVTIKCESAESTEFYSKLKNKMGDPKTAYLTSNDLNDFAQQTLDNVIVTEYQDSTFVPTRNNRLQIMDLIKEILTIGRETIESADDHRWSSVFWNADWSRPDYLTHFLNDTFKLNQSSSRNFTFYDSELQTYLERHHVSVDTSEESWWSWFAGSTVSKVRTSSSSSKEEKRTKLTISEDNTRDWLLQNHDRIEWTGKKFQVKPTNLSRVNLQKLTSDTKLTVTSIQSIKITVDGKAQLQILTEAKNCTELSDTWEQRFDEFDEKLKVLSNTVMTVENQTSDMNWIRTHNYCIWKYGACPDGFDYIKGYPEDNIYFGDSHLKGKRSSIDMFIAVCCKPFHKPTPSTGTGTMPTGTTPR